MSRCFAILTLFVAAAAAAQERPKAPVFISQSAIEEAARETVLHPKPALHVDFGDVVYENRFGRARFNYLPFMRTLPYTFPAPNWNQIPNAFELLGVR
jgi:hypothetical protein